MFRRHSHWFSKWGTFFFCNYIDCNGKQSEVQHSIASTNVFRQFTKKLIKDLLNYGHIIFSSKHLP